jgi:signal transduction histidine kinase
MTNSIFDLGNYYWNGYALPHFLVGVFIALEGIFVFFQSKKAVARISYLLTTMTAGIWLTGVGIACSMSNEAVSTSFSRYYTWFGIIFVTPAVYFFSATWNAGLLKAKKKWIYFNFLSGAGFYLVCVTTPWIVLGMYPYSTGYFPKAGFLELPFIFWFYTLMSLSFMNFFRIYRGVETAGFKKTIRLIFTAFVIAFFGSVEYLPNYGIHIFPVAFLPVFLFTTIIGYCVIRYKAMDIETVIHKTVMWLATTLVAIVPFAALIYWTQRFRDPSSAWGSTFYYLAVAIAFYFYFRSLQPRLDHLFQRQRRNLLAVFEAFSRELVLLKNLRDLLQSFARMLRRQIYVRRLSVFLLDEKSGEFIPAIAKGLRNLKPISKGHSFLAWLESKDTVVMGDLIGSDPEVEAFKNEIEEFFRATQGMVAVPLVLGGKLIGVVSLGRKANLRPYRPNEVRFLTELKIPVTIAFSNSMRYDDIRALSEELKSWNVELEHRVEDRTRELVRTQEQLIQAEKLATLGTLAGGVAHEINNPLTAVLTNAQILKMTADEDVKESLDLIEEGAKRCQGIVQKLMKYARKTAEEAPHKDVDLRDVVKGTCALLGFQFRQENIEVEVKLGDVPPVKGIAGELDQVLTNLLVNARDAILSNSPSKDSKGNWTGPGNLLRTENGGQGQAAKTWGKITIETRKTPEAVELVVADNGIGIPKENQKKIFDPFFTTKDVGSGTGLGLAVSFGILKRHNAAISVASIPGKGATFTVRFPI